MYRFYIHPAHVFGDTLEITGTDVNHIKNVLRMRQGEKLIACDGQGMDFLCEIVSLEYERILLKELSHKHSETELPVRVTLFQGIPKRDKMELIIQKSVELGVACIVPVAMKRCIVKIEEEKKEKKKRNRWQAIAEAAAKQSGRGMIPAISPSMDFLKAIRSAMENQMEILLPYENAKGMRATKKAFVQIACEKTQDIALFIGPEGGFDDAEIALAREAGAQIISLGSRILRTETAGMAALAMLMYEIESAEK